MVNSQILRTAILAFFFVAASQANAKYLPDFTGLVEDFSPSVVNISAKRGNTSQQEMFRGSPFWPFFQPPGGGNQYMPKPRSQGSGFIISRDGYILTNHHVVQDAESITVVLDNETEYEATVVGEDPATDVALLKIKAKNLKPARLGDSKGLKVGEWVLAFGAPFGFEKTVTAGIISAKSRSLPNDQFVNFLQSDVAINPGNSGGPLVNMKGEVVGINSQIYSRSGAFAGIAFSIPIEIAIDVTEQLKNHGQVKRGFLGVGYQEVSAEEAKSVGLGRARGALINSVGEDSPAEKGGIQVGDIILELNDFPINRHEELPIVVGRLKPGTKVKVDYFRDGKVRSTRVTLVERQDTIAANTRGRGENADTLQRLGVRVDDLTQQQKRSLNIDHGVLVSRVMEGAAGEAGIRDGDVILSVNRKQVTSARAFVGMMRDFKAGDAVSLLVLSTQSNTKRFVSFTIPDAE